MRDVISDLIYMFIISNLCTILIILGIDIIKQTIRDSKEMKEVEEMAKRRDKKWVVEVIVICLTELKKNM